MSSVIILQQMAVIAILVGIGIYLYKKEVIRDDTSKRISMIVTDVCNPAMIMSCVLTGDIKASHRELLTALAVAVMIYIGLCMAGFFLPILLKIEKKERRFYNLMTVYANVGFMGIPLAKAVLSDTAMLYVIVFNVIFCLFFYTHGIYVIYGGSEKIQIKNILSPGSIMSVLTILVFWFDFGLPVVLENSIVYLGNATVFLSMTLLGVSIARADMKEGLKEKKIYPYLFLRMIVLPLGITWILKVVGLPWEMVQAFCLMTAMPAANLPLIQAEKTGENTEILSRGIMMTTILSLFTVTIVLSLM